MFAVCSFVPLFALNLRGGQLRWCPSKYLEINDRDANADKMRMEIINNTITMPYYDLYHTIFISALASRHLIITKIK